ncbi:NAD(P)-binding protein [Hypoxylon crocopeplum]|nr:NAD(P)-binding protein [Hypoxylon crocopeplum]
MSTIAITGASGKLGGATLSALLAHNLAPAPSIVALTSSQPTSPTWTALAAKGVQVRHASFEDPASFDAALQGVDKLFLVSTPHIALDFGDETQVPDGKGREGHHRVAIDAAVRAGVRYVYYSSLAFAWSSSKGGPGLESKAGVMRAHLRTETYLTRLSKEGKLAGVVFVREGLYNESWPLYLGYFDARTDDRGEVRVAADGRVCWTSIKDLGIASALVLVAPGDEYAGRTFYLSTSPKGARSLAEVAALVAKARGRDVSVKIVGSEEYERHYVEDRRRDRPAVKWWASTYAALADGECLVDDPTLERLLATVGVKPTPIEETISAMVEKA